MRHLKKAVGAGAVALMIGAAGVTVAPQAVAEQAPVVSAVADTGSGDTGSGTGSGASPGVGNPSSAEVLFRTLLAMPVELLACVVDLPGSSELSRPQCFFSHPVG